MRQLCDANDIIFLQETWLTFEELSMLKSVHADFYADGVTAMDTSSGLLLGRRFGGIAIFFFFSMDIISPDLDSFRAAAVGVGVHPVA